MDIGNTYRNDKAAQQFTHFIAAVEEEKLRKGLKSTNFLSVLSDGSTDSSFKEQEIVYSRFCQGGVITEKFIGIVDVEKADAVGIKWALDTAMNNIGLDDWKKKLVAVATDGASVNIGCKSGLITRLHDEDNMQHIIGVHCYAHKLELAVKDATKNVPCHEKVQLLLKNLWLYYRTALNRAGLLNSFKSLNQQSLVPTRAGGTRWAAHTLKAVSHIIQGFGGIVTHLEQVASGDLGATSDAENKAKGFLKVLKCSSYLQYMHFLHDILTHIAGISQFMQKRGITLAEAHDVLTATKLKISMLQEIPGPMESKFNDQHNYCGKDIVRGNAPDFTASKLKVICGFTAAIDNRFSDVNSGVMEATRILAIHMWPDDAADSDFGGSSVTVAAKHFSKVLDTVGVDFQNGIREWPILKK